MSAATALLFVVQISAHLKVLAHGEIRKHAASFRRHGDAARDELVRRLTADVFVFENDLPERGWSRPVIVRRVVVLPAPFAPISVTTSPLLDVQGDAGQRFDGAIVYGDVFEGQHFL